MRRYELTELGDALDAFAAFKPDAPDRTRRSFARKVGEHLGRDYKGSHGLRLVGLGGHECRSSIVFWVGEDDATEIEYMVTVFAPGGRECFDMQEALGYSNYIKLAHKVEQLKAEIKQDHIELRRNEPCDE